MKRYLWYNYMPKELLKKWIIVPINLDQTIQLLQVNSTALCEWITCYCYSSGPCMILAYVNCTSKESPGQGYTLRTYCNTSLKSDVMWIKHLQITTLVSALSFLTLLSSSLLIFGIGMNRIHWTEKEATESRVWNRSQHRQMTPFSVEC
jgi:hypothetical protein